MVSYVMVSYVRVSYVRVSYVGVSYVGVSYVGVSYVGVRFNLHGGDLLAFWLWRLDVHHHLVLFLYRVHVQSPHIYRGGQGTG